MAGRVDQGDTSTPVTSSARPAAGRMPPPSLPPPVSSSSSSSRPRREDWEPRLVGAAMKAFRRLHEGASSWFTLTDLLETVLDVTDASHGFIGRVVQPHDRERAAVRLLPPRSCSAGHAQGGATSRARRQSSDGVGNGPVVMVCL